MKMMKLGYVALGVLTLFLGVLLGFAGSFWMVPVIALGSFLLITQCTGEKIADFVDYILENMVSIFFRVSELTGFLLILVDGYRSVGIGMFLSFLGIELWCRKKKVL